MPKIRYPLAQAFMSRDGTIGARDAFVQNGYLAKFGEKNYVIKRPGVTFNTNIGVNANFQGKKYYNGFIYAIINDTLYRTSGTINSATDGTSFTQATVPAWLKRTEAASCVFDDRLWIIGSGIASTGAAITGDVWSTADGMTWAVATSGAGAARLGHRVCVLNKKMFIIGGRNAAGTVLNDVISSSNGVDWPLLNGSAPWVARQHFGLVAANNGMYLFGGADGSTGNYNDVWFSPDGESWNQISTGAAWSARNSFGTAFFNNKLWVIGGFAGGFALNDVWSSPDGISWTLETNGAFTSGRFGMSVVVYNNKMWTIGGANGTTNFSDVYSSSTGSSWTLVTASPGFGARVNPTAQVFRTPSTVSQYRYPTIWVMGGGPNGAEFKDVWYGNLNTSTQVSYLLNPTSFGQAYQIETYMNGTRLLIKNQSNFWVLEAGSLIKVTDPNYPPTTVPGLVVLNGFAYVMTPEGLIQGCKIDDATQWPALQFTTADYEDDPGVHLAKFLNYVVAMGQYTIQFFYDAANPPPGISLGAYINANLRMGVAFSATVRNIKNTLIWVGATTQREWGVYIMEGMVPKKVSSDWVDRVLDTKLNSGSIAFATSSGTGHTFYVLVFSDGNALAFDMDTAQWHPWTAPGGFNFSHAETTFFSAGDLWFGSGPRGGQIYYSNVTYNDDAGLLFQLMVQSDKLDGGNIQRKFWGSVDIIADQSDSVINVSWSDDDYRTWSLPIAVSMGTDRVRINRLGSSRRRAWRFSQTDSLPARWEAAEFTFSEGES